MSTMPLNRDATEALENALRAAMLQVLRTTHVKSTVCSASVAALSHHMRQIADRVVTDVLREQRAKDTL